MYQEIEYELRQANERAVKSDKERADNDSAFRSQLAALNDLNVHLRNENTALTADLRTAKEILGGMVLRGFTAKAIGWKDGR